MTQMLLFDPPSVSAPVTAPTLPEKDVSTAPSAKRVAASASVNNHKAGLNHMGDLARLVLLRYELVAKRRAELAARRAKQAK